MLLKKYLHHTGHSSTRLPRASPTLMPDMQLILCQLKGSYHNSTSEALFGPCKTETLLRAAAIY